MKLLSFTQSTRTQLRRSYGQIKRNYDRSRCRGQRPLSSGMSTTPTSTSTTTERPEVHIIGLGNVTKLIAHSLMTSSPNPPNVTVVFRDMDRFQSFAKAGHKITLSRKNDVDSTTEELVAEGFKGASPDKLKANHIRVQTLIVGTKAYDALSAVRDIVFRLDAESEVIFVQNGMGRLIPFVESSGACLTWLPGIYEEVRKHLFYGGKAEHRTPKFYQMIVSHGLYATPTNPFGSVHAGRGKVYLGPVLEDGQPEDTVRTKRLLKLFLPAKSVLNLEVVSRDQLLLRQLDKLVANAIINPLTAIFAVKNGEILHPEKIPEMEKDMSMLYEEISAILSFHIGLNMPPKSNDMTDAAYTQQLSRYSVKNLKKIVNRVAEMTAENTSSMLADVQAGRKTEIDYINGYLVQLGKKYTLPTATNERIVRRVKSKFSPPETEDTPIIPRDPRYQVAMVLKELRKKEKEKKGPKK
ncbi:hypothetical protein BJ508DRAFT_379757 [Ascobolus immersus RN42]|uniref:2-dehydropantoate 2-reductase n=1 Tax=Ascobolus immersus RN42 TaxID=1160509 RepID=A0A3N4HSI3_ASCIM|nr:hypothetical protein BJ508DRAFT_379757 [Ascobolus immersus RN42]